MADHHVGAEARPETDLDNLEAEQLEIGGDGDAPSSEYDIREPFDPSEISVATKGITVDLLLRRLKQNELTLQPDFQRALVWTRGAQSRLIESMLIRLPLPLFYFDASDDDNWLTVDGLQRLTAIREYVVDETFELRELEFLHDFEGYRFSDLPRSFQRRIEETEMQVSLIQSGTPEDVKFNLFKRINTGGMPLSPQEIRHALNQGTATELLKDMAASPEFKDATSGGVTPRRMADRELALRFLAFSRIGSDGYSATDLDVFLHEEMKYLNGASESERQQLQRRFRYSMLLAHDLFDKHAFRKVFKVDQEWRSPINKALFDAWSVGLGALSKPQRQALRKRERRLYAEYVRLINDESFFSSISQGTGQGAKVRLRLSEVEKAIAGVLK